jgi:hypothetical protein
LAREFKVLQKYWYELLRDTGFKDIENTEGLLKEWDFNFFRMRFNAIQYEATKSYYDQARHLLHTFEFKNEMEKAIWELHCEGLSERKISQHLKKFRKSWVHVIIARIASQIKKD